MYKAAAALGPGSRKAHVRFENLALYFTVLVNELFPAFSASFCLQIYAYLCINWLTFY